MKWIATYMALSRVQSLKQFRGIGIDNSVRELINNGPPPGMLTKFLNMFQEKATETEALMHQTLRELGWT
jgi:hypothetical protein